MPSTKKVLVIDDDPDIQAILRTTLERAGYEVASAMDALQGTTLARKEAPALIIRPNMISAATKKRVRHNPKVRFIT